MKDVLFKTLVVYLLLSGVIFNIGLVVSTIHIYVLGS